MFLLNCGYVKTGQHMVNYETLQLFFGIYAWQYTCCSQNTVSGGDIADSQPYTHLFALDRGFLSFLALPRIQNWSQLFLKIH